MAVGRWLHDNPHTHYTSTNATAATVYMTDGTLKYMTSGATQSHANDWLRLHTKWLAAAAWWRRRRSLQCILTITWHTLSVISF